jgi:5-aminolevulinate synthase
VHSDDDIEQLVKALSDIWGQCALHRVEAAA